MMQDRPSTRLLSADLGALLISRTVGYLVFLLNFPFVLSLIAMLFAVLLVLLDVFHFDLRSMYNLPYIGSRIPVNGEFHGTFNGTDLLRWYAIVAFVWFLIIEIIRAVFRLKRPSLRRRILTAIVIATLGWGLVIANVPRMRMAPGSSRTGLATTFIVLYVLGAGGFVVGALIQHSSDGLVDRIAGTAESVQ